MWYSGCNAVAFLVVYCNSPEPEFFVVDQLMKYRGYDDPSCIFNYLRVAHISPFPLHIGK